MALLDDVKSELAAIDNELPIAKKAQATSMIRFGNGLHTVDHHVLVQAQLDSKDAALWLQDTIKNLYGHETTLTPVSRQTPTGIVQRYVIRVPKGSAALVLQTGLYSRYTKNMVLGLPSEIINGKITQIKAAWRGAFLANGRLSDPGKASYLEIVCPNHEAALALVSTARRLGITAKSRRLRSSERVTLRDPDAIERMLILMGAPIPLVNGPVNVPTVKRGARRIVWRISMTPICAVAPRPLPRHATRCVRPLRFWGMTFPTISSPRDSCVSTMPMPLWNSWDVLPSRRSPRMPSQAASVDCFSSPKRPRRHDDRTPERRNAIQNTMHVFERHGVFVRLGLYDSEVAIWPFHAYCG